MTDKEIINSIKEYVDWAYDTNIAKLTYDEINDFYDLVMRQQAEIEKLNVELVGMRGACNSYKMHYDNAKAEIERLKAEARAVDKDLQELDRPLIEIRAEAIKEFADRLKELSYLPNLSLTNMEVVDISEIDNLVKEMVGDDK